MQQLRSFEELSKEIDKFLAVMHKHEAEDESRRSKMAA